MVLLDRHLGQPALEPDAPGSRRRGGAARPRFHRQARRRGRGRRNAIDAADEVGGNDIIAWEGKSFPSTTYGIVSAPGAGIAGGSNEIQRGIIGERVLGLAKDPQLDREIPFNELRKATMTFKTPTR